MKKLLVLAQGMFEGTFYCRHIVPDRLLNEYSDDLTITIEKDPRDISWHDYDAVLLYRWYHPQFLNFLKQLRKQVDIPILYETDDNLLSVPAYNYASSMLSRSTIKEIMSLCDGYIFSTNIIKDVTMTDLGLEGRTKPCAIIENRLDRDLWGAPTFNVRNPGDPLRLGYEGTGNRFSMRGNSHLDDFEHLEKILVKHTANRMQAYQWVFFGGMPQNIVSPAEVEYHPWVETYKEFVEVMKNLNLHVGMSPLRKNDFNRCKSNIKRLDYYACGALGLYSKSPIYEDPNCPTPSELILLNSDIAWDKMLIDLEEDDSLRHELWMKEHKYFTENPDKIWLQDHISERHARIMGLMDVLK